MSELDDLRRIAYGRTTSAAEEAAAADARAALARHDAAVRAERAALEADAFARTRAAERAPVSDGEPDADEHATLTIVEVGDEPGLLRRFAASWRVWAVPAFTAFVAGIVLTVTSGVFVFTMAGSAGGTSTTRSCSIRARSSGKLPTTSNGPPRCSRVRSRAKTFRRSPTSR
jgi:hypothetical protein